MQIDGMRLLNKVVRDHGLCPKMCFLQDDKIDCVGIEEKFCEGICKNSEDINAYNKKVEQAIQQLSTEHPTLAHFGPGRNEKEFSCVLIGKNDFLAVGFVPLIAMKWKKEKLIRNLEPAASNEFIRSLVFSAAASDPDMTVEFD
jgi:DNA polymerase-3 subunit epsilon